MASKIITFLLITISMLLVLSFWKIGVPETHDGQIHLARAANFYLALKEGQIPPRWAPNLNSGFGYPIFIFNYPFPSALVSFFMIIGASITTAYKLTITLACLASSIGMYLLLKRRLDYFPAIIGTIVYLYSPYVLVNLYVRGNIGEIISFSLLPWVLYTLDLIIEKPTRIAITSFICILACLLLTHNLTAILSLGLIISYTLFVFRQKSRFLIAPVSTALFLVAFFWVPAIGEKHFTVLEKSPINTQFSDQFPTLQQLFFSPWSYGYSYPGPVDSMSFQIGIPNLMLSILALILMILKRKSFPKFAHYFVFVFVGSFFLMLPISSQFWSLFPFLRFIQFPWRLLFFTTFSSAILAGFGASKINSKLICSAIGVIAFIALIPITRPDKIINFSDDYYFSYPHTSTTLNENDPVWFDRDQAFSLFAQISSPIIANDPEALVIIKSWSGFHHQYQISSSNPTTVIEKTMYFPGWKTTINGKEVNLYGNKERFFGLINSDIPAGTSSVDTRFVGNSSFQQFGSAISILGIISLGYMIGRTGKYT